MVAYVIFIKERAHNQGELDLYKEMAPAALAGHPITLRIAHGHKELVSARGDLVDCSSGFAVMTKRAARRVQLRVA